MRSKYAGQCGICQQPYEVGDEIWWEKGMASVCIGCHDAGHRNPPRAASGRTNDPAPPPLSGQPDLSDAILRELAGIRLLLEEIRDALARPNQPAEPPEPNPF